MKHMLLGEIELETIVAIGPIETAGDPHFVVTAMNGLDISVFGGVETLMASRAELVEIWRNLDLKDGS